MNIQIFCCENNPLQNKINSFKMPLDTPIDGRTSDMFIKINQFNFPLTTPNAENSQDCWFHLKIDFEDFKLNVSKTKIWVRIVFN